MVKRGQRDVARRLIEKMLETRKATTVRSVFGRVAPAADGAIRSVMNPGGTETGRFSHSATFLEASTNLGNLPKKVAGLDPLYDVRSVIVPSAGRYLWEADLSQAEARVAAWMCGDPLAMKQYREGTDRYKALAAAAFHGGPDDVAKVTKPQRHVGKTGVLSLQYGVSWKTFMDQTNLDADLTGVSIDAKTAKRVFDAFHAIHPRYATWWDDTLHEVCTRGYLVNVYGRKRIFFARALSAQEREALRREAVAFLPQSTIADHLNTSFRLLHGRPEHGTFFDVRLQVHDALIGECDPAKLMTTKRIVQTALERPLDLPHGTLTVPSDFMYSPDSWATMKEL